MRTFWAVLAFAYPIVFSLLVAAWRKARDEANAHKSRIDGAIHLCESVEARDDLHPQARVLAEDIRGWLTPTAHSPIAPVPVVEPEYEPHRRDVWPDDCTCGGVIGAPCPLCNPPAQS